MKVACPISQNFMEGFVEQCSEMGMTLDETESLFHKHCNNALFARPDIYEGFREKIASYPGDRAKLARFLTPDVISLAANVRVCYGDDPLSAQLRNDMDIPDPSWDNVPEHVKVAASQIAQLVDIYDYLSLPQKILLASVIGGGLGGITRGANPSAEDMMAGRGPINRMARGTLRGAGMGAGAATGGSMASLLSSSMRGERPLRDARLPETLLGGGLGALGANKLMSGI